MAFRIAFISLTFIFSIAVFAETGLETCRGISFSSDREECFESLVGNYFDEDAGFVCGRARFNSGILKCVKTSINREYTEGDAIQCDDESFDDDRAKCMGRLGEPSFGDSSLQGRLRSINHFAVSALSAIQVGNLNLAYNIVSRIFKISNLPPPK